jgi:hypothetical protein
MASSSEAISAAVVRKELRQIKDNVEKNRHVYASAHSTGLSDAIDKVQGMYDVTKTDSRASAIDAQVLNVASAVGADQAAALDKATPDKFIRQLLKKYAPAKCYFQHCPLANTCRLRELMCDPLLCLRFAGSSTATARPTTLSGRYWHRQ